MSKEFTDFLAEHGIQHETSAPWTPQQNGLTERMNQTLLGGSCALLEHSGMTKGFWAEAMGTAAHILNRSPRKNLDWRTPYELFYGRAPDISYFRIFGCRAWVFNDQGKKWDPKSLPMIFVGYEFGSKAYRLWNPKTQSIVISANVRFDETEFPNRPAPSLPPTHVPSRPIATSSKTKLEDAMIHMPWSFNNDETSQIPPPPSHPPLPHQIQLPPSPPDTSSGSSSSSDVSTPPPPASPAPFPDNYIDDPLSQPSPSTPPTAGMPTIQPPAPRKSTRVTKLVKPFIGSQSSLGHAKSEGDQEALIDTAYLHHVELYVATILPGEPSGYLDAVEGDNKEHWLAAMNEEISSLEGEEPGK